MALIAIFSKSGCDQMISDKCHTCMKWAAVSKLLAQMAQVAAESN